MIAMINVSSWISNHYKEIMGLLKLITTFLFILLLFSLMGIYPAVAISVVSIVLVCFFLGYLLLRAEF